MENGDVGSEDASRESSSDYYHYYNDYSARGELAKSISYDESCVSGTTSNSTPDSSPWPAYPSGYSMTHIVISAVVVTTIMLVIILGNVLVVAAVALERSLARTQEYYLTF